MLGLKLNHVNKRGPRWGYGWIITSYKQKWLRNHLFMAQSQLISVSKRGFNSLRHSDAIWRHRYGLTLTQVIVCCLKAPSHYLNLCWPIITKVLRYSLKITFLKLNWNLPEANELISNPCLSIRLCSYFGVIHCRHRSMLVQVMA